MRMHARYAAFRLPVTLTVALVAACTASEVTDGRGPVSLAAWEVAVVAEDTLELMIPSCFGEPELADPLGDRQVVDVTSGEPMRLTRPTATPG